MQTSVLSEDDSDPEQDRELTEQALPPPEPGTTPALAKDTAHPHGLPLGLSLPRQVFALAIWPFFEQVLSFMVGFVDTALAGHLSVEATSAIGIAAYVMWLVAMLQGAIGVGAGALVARHVGAGRWQRASKTLSQAVILSFVWSTLLGIFLYFVAPIIGSRSGLVEERLALCTQYLQLLALTVPFSGLLNIGTACLRGAGDTRTPFLVMVTVNLVNAAFSLLFALDGSPIGGFGLAGVAMGTMVAWLVGATSIVVILLRKKEGVKIQHAHLHPTGKLLRRLIRIGLPNLFENLGMWIGNFIVLSFVGHLPDPAAVGTHIIAIRLEAMSFLPGFAVGIAAATMAGQYLGARNPQKARAAVLWCLLYGTSLMTAVGLTFIFFPTFYVSLMTTHEVFLKNSPPLLFMTGFIQLSFAISIVLGMALRGSGDTRAVMMITYGSTFLIRLPLTYLLGIHYQMGLYGIWVGLTIELFLRGIWFMLRFFHGSWMHKKI